MFLGRLRSWTSPEGGFRSSWYHKESHLSQVFVFLHLLNQVTDTGPTATFWPGFHLEKKRLLVLAHYSQPLSQHCVRHMTTSDTQSAECNSWFKWLLHTHTSDPLARG